MQQIKSRGYALPAQKYKKDFLLKILRENLTEHKRAYEEAVEAYKVKAAEFLKKTKTKILKALKEQAALVEATVVGARISGCGVTSEWYPGRTPTSQAHFYERAISQLEGCIADEIELDDAAYTCFVDDEWEWSGQFNETVLEYGGSLSKKRP